MKGVEQMISDPVFQLELQIQSDKLKQGINGLEWLVLQTYVDEATLSGMASWLRVLKIHGYQDIYRFMKNVIIMDPESFYKKYELNWWISIDETLNYLSWLRKQDYDRYFDFIQSVYEGDKP